MNICLLSREYPPETLWGGIGSYTHRLAEGLVKAGQSVYVITLSLNQERVYEANGVIVHRIPLISKYPFKFGLHEFGTRLEYSELISKKVGELHSKIGIDVVESPNFYAEGFSSLSRKIPFVTRVHTQN